MRNHVNRVICFKMKSTLLKLKWKTENVMLNIRKRLNDPHLQNQDTGLFDSFLFSVKSTQQFPDVQHFNCRKFPI